MDMLLTSQTGSNSREQPVIFPLYGRDRYYIYALNALLTTLFIEEPELEKWVPDIWLIAEVRDIFCCIDRLRENSDSVVIGDARHYRLLCGIPGLRWVCFVDASLAVDEMKQCFKAILRRRPYCSRLGEHRLSDVTAFSARTRKIIGLLLQGFSPHVVARECDIQAKTVSLYKRSVMQRLNVNSTQELVIKSALMKAQW
ncbi:helix-turn-helix transcriptional regulator [Serratia rubidaea]|uniref:helix-turn-helix transcriptional regulator n=1 Tax=Serratia rubidaea TaxID=61652 RepID=UPI0024C4E4F7|nr:LuxR C-terminal-related transcriptional regulator [Serratia rubidaea]